MLNQLFVRLMVRLVLVLTVLKAASAMADPVGFGIHLDRREDKRVVVYSTLTYSLFGVWVIPLPGLPVTFEADHGELTPTEDLYALTGDPTHKGIYRSILTPPERDEFDDVFSGEIHLVSKVFGYTTSKTALIVDVIDPRLGQPEKLGGLINTRGMEDSPEVSPDGRFVIVGSYSPIDFGYCAVNGHDYQHPACNSNFYDFSGVERPGLFGADRILSHTEIDHRIPSLNYDPKTSPFPIATPPVASFGFRLQPDGSYAEPFVMGIDADGYSWQQTYGFTFDWTFGDFAAIFFSWNELGEQPETNNDIYGALVRLGQEVKIGEYQDSKLVNFAAVKANIDPVPVCGQLDCEFGNPQITPTRIWFDNERQSDDLFFADRIGAGFGPPKRVPVSQVDRGETMPHFFGNTLYYMCNTGLCASDLSEGADPALLESWSPERQIMAPLTRLPWTINAGRAGRVVAVSEPSLATVREGQQEQLYLYFGYITQTQYGTGEKDFGADWAVGRVRIR